MIHIVYAQSVLKSNHLLNAPRVLGFNILLSARAVINDSATADDSPAQLGRP